MLNIDSNTDEKYLEGYKDAVDDMIDKIDDIIKNANNIKSVLEDIVEQANNTLYD